MTKRKALTERKAFEQWYLTEHGRSPRSLFYDREREMYDDELIDAMWHGWRAKAKRADSAEPRESA